MKKMGRPPKNPLDKTLSVTLSIPQEHVIFIDECAKLLKISRSQFVTVIMQNGLDDAKLMKNVGFFHVVGRVREIMARHREQFSLPLTYS